MTGEGQKNADGGEQDALDKELKMSQQMYRPNKKGQKLSDERKDQERIFTARQESCTVKIKWGKFDPGNKYVSSVTH